MSNHPTNSQIAEAVCDTNLEVLGNGPSLSQAYLDTTMVETTGLMMNQAVAVQQNAQTARNASLTAVCAKLLRVPGKINPVPVEEPRPPVSPLANQGQLGAEISANFNQAQSAIGTMNHDLRSAENNIQNARNFLRSLADLAKPTVTKNDTSQ